MPARACAPFRRLARAAFALLFALAAPAWADGSPQVSRVLAGGGEQPLELPFDESAGPGTPGPLRVHVRVRVDLGAAPRDRAIYLSGLIAHARIAVNGAVIEDRLLHADEPLPRSLHRIRLLPVPDALWRSGVNTIDLELAGTRYLSLSPVRVASTDALESEHEARLLAAVVGPAVVATIMCCLGLCVLALWIRQRSEPMHALFGTAALGWGLHSAWTVLPFPLLPGIHNVVGWTGLYAAVVMLLVLFCLRFSGWRHRGVERALWAVMVGGMPALYAAGAAGMLLPAAEALRALCVVLVAAAIGLVTVRAAARRDVAGVLMVAAAGASLAFGARDWWVAHTGEDNNPVYLTPYAGLLFVALVSWMLVDGFVVASRALASLNADLEARVARHGAALRQALDDAQRARDAAEAASRAKSMFLAAASHDLRQPVHALGLNLAAIARDGLPAAAREALDRLRASLAALGSMFDALLDLSRMESGALVPQAVSLDLGALLHRLGDEFGPLAEARGLRLVLRGPPAHDPRGALADPMLLERVMRNLLDNALRCTRQGGVLVRWRLDRNGMRWNLAVWDTGCGIAPADQARVFEEFQQVAGAGGARSGGLGLGLAIVRRLSDLMDLRIRLASRPGRGSRFSLSLPATPLAAPVAPASEPAPLPPDRCVAVVEDDEGVRAAMVALLQRWGCRCVDGPDAQGVLAVWAASGRPPAGAVVADLQLDAGLDGRAAIAALRAAWGCAALPALVVTGAHPAPGFGREAAPGIDWAAKPLPAERLHAWLARALAEPQGAAETRR